MRHIAIKTVPMIDEMDLTRYLINPRVTLNFDSGKIVGKCLAVAGNAVKIEFFNTDCGDMAFYYINYLNCLPSWVEKDGKKELVELSLTSNQTTII